MKHVCKFRLILGIFSFLLLFISLSTIDSNNSVYGAQVEDGEYSLSAPDNMYLGRYTLKSDLKEITISLQGTDNMFSVLDKYGDDIGYKTILVASGGLVGINKGYSIPISNFFIKANNSFVEKLEGEDNENVLLNSGSSLGYISLEEDRSWIIRENKANNGKTGKYGQTFSLKLKIPANTPADKYIGKIKFSLVKNQGKQCTLPWGGLIDHESEISGYSQSLLPYGEPCENVHKTSLCYNGTLSDENIFATCTNQEALSCDLPRGDSLNHGTSTQVYTQGSVPYSSTCDSSINVSCDNGTLSYQGDIYQQCTTQEPMSCTLPWGGTISHSGAVSAFQSAVVGWGGSCQSEVRNCDNGILYGSYENLSCTVADPLDCELNRGTLLHGNTTGGYTSGSVEWNQNCSAVEQSISCENGSLKNIGTNQYITKDEIFRDCEVKTPLTCDFNGQEVLHENTIIGYSSSTVPYGSTCDSISYTKICTNGILDYPEAVASSCTVADPLDCDFNGQTINHGSGVLAYQYSDQSCTNTQTRTCDNGSLDGSYTYDSCSESPGGGGGEEPSIFVLGTAGDVYRSMDGGTTFSSIDVGCTIAPATSMSAIGVTNDNKYVYVKCPDGLYRSPNYGDSGTFTKVVNLGNWFFDFSADGQYFLVTTNYSTDKKTYYSSDYGETFTLINNGTYYGVSVTDNGKYMAYNNITYNVTPDTYYSNDYGQTRTSKDLIQYEIMRIARSEDGLSNLITSIRRGISVSFDEDFSTVTNKIYQTTARGGQIAEISLDGTAAISKQNYTYYLSKNSLSSFSSISASVCNSSSIMWGASMSHLSSNGNVIGYCNQLSIDHGATFRTVSECTDIQHVSRDGQSVACINRTTNKIYRSLDGGVTFSEIINPTSSLNSVNIHPR